MRRLLLLLLWPALVVAQQPWTGILSSSRAIDWSSAGLQTSNWPVAGETAPVNPWTPPPRTTVCTALAAGTSTATINSTIAACPTGQTVTIGAGSTTVTATIQLKSGVTLRAVGDSKLVVGTNHISYPSSPSDSPGPTWTAGYSAGTTSITIGSSLPVGSYLRLGATGESFDPGGLFDCGTNTTFCSQQGGVNAQYQLVKITGISGSGPFTATISPALYLSFAAPLSGPATNKYTANTFGVGLEDFTIDCTGHSSGGDCVDMRYTANSWIKGNRILGALVGGEQQSMQATAHSLVMNNYYYTNVAPASNTETITLNTTGDNLIFNNICQQTYGFVYVKAPQMGDVVSYNLVRDGAGTVISQGRRFLNNIIVGHDITTLMLLEGNQFGGLQLDSIHSTHKLDTLFRNTIFGNDPPYNETDHITPVDFEGYSRFMNVVGNALGSSAQTNYKCTPASTTLGIYSFGLQCGFTGYQPYDSTVFPNAMLWGNYDPVTGQPRFCGGTLPSYCGGVAEVPSAIKVNTGFQLALSGSGSGPYTGTIPNLPCVLGDLVVMNNNNGVGSDTNASGTITGSGIASSPASTVNCSNGAVSITFTGTPTNPTLNYLQQTGTNSPFQNAVPASHTLPASFYNSAALDSVRQVCVSWSTFPTSCSGVQTVPNPPIGPDIVGGTLQGGFANEIPASVLYDNLPIDTAYQNSFAITGWAFNAGTQTETLTVTINGTFLVTGEFQISGATGAGCTGLQTHGMTNSTSTTIQFAAASNPGCSGGSVLWPDVRKFSELAYQPASTAALTITPPGPITCPTIVSGTTATCQSFTLQNTGTITLTGLFTNQVLSDLNNFQIFSNTCTSTLAPSATCTFGLRFTPQSVNTFNGTLTFITNDPASPDVVNFSGTSTPPQANTPTFSPPAGTYSNAIAVTISSTSPGAVICYTNSASPAPATDGASGCTTGTLFSGPISVSGTTNFFAVAGGTGYVDSAIGTGTYITTVTGTANTVFARNFNRRHEWQQKMYSQLK